MQIDVTLWRTFARGRCDRHTWRSFVETFVHDPEIVRDKKSVAGFSLACFEEDRRTLSRVEHVHAVVLDLDHGDPTFEAIERAFEGALGVVYTTFSHKPKSPRLRAIFPLSRPVKAAEYDRVWLWAKKRCEDVSLKVDASARDASHLFFLPSHPPGAEYIFRELKGRPLDVEHALEQIPHTLVVVPCRKRESQGTTTSGGGRDNTASGHDWRLALRLVREGWSDEEIMDELRRVSHKYQKRTASNDRYSECYVEFTVHKAREVHEANTPVMGVERAILHCLPPRFAHPERRHVHLELASEDGEDAQTQIIIPAPWHAGAVGVTWRACFPDIEPDLLLGPWNETREIWNDIRWRGRLFEVALRDEEVRWIRAVGAPAPQSQLTAATEQCNVR
jgi:hypothetical protein